MRAITFGSGTAGPVAQEKTTFAKASQAASKIERNNLLNEVMKRTEVKNDRALAKALEVAPPVISKIRHGRLPVGATLAVSMHEAADISIAEITSILAGNASA